MEDSNKNMYKFKKPLIKATIIKRNSQFTATVSLKGNIIDVHVPNTGRIGDVNSLIFFICKKIKIKE